MRVKVAFVIIPPMFKTAYASLLVLFLALFFYRPIEIEDVWWHLRTGQWILEHAQVPDYDIFSPVEPACAGISPQWMGSSFYYLLYSAGGLPGLKLFRAGFFLLVVLIFLLRYHKKIPPSLLFFLALCMAYGLGTRCYLRPFVFNFIFIPVFLSILLAYEKDRNYKRLYVLPLLAILWVNVHMGSLVYGFLLIGIFWFSAIIRGDGRAVRDLTLTLAAYLAAFFVNPYGVKGAVYPFKVFLDPEFIKFPIISNAIRELSPPGYIFSAEGIWFFALVGLGIWALTVNKRDNFTRILLFVVALFFFLRIARASEFFTLVAGYLIADTAANMIQEGNLKFRLPRPIGYAVHGLIILFLLFGIISIGNQKVFFKGRTVKSLSLDCIPDNPKTALKFLTSNNIKGPLFNTDSLGGYLIWAGYPEYKPFADTRQYNPELFVRYLYIANRPAQYWAKAEEEFNFKIIMLDVSKFMSAEFLQYMKGRPDWQLVFMDGPVIVYVKRGEFTLPREAQNLETDLRSVNVVQEDIRKLKEYVLSNPSANFLNPPPYYVDTLEEAATLFDLGYWGAGMKRLLTALDVNHKKAKPAAISVLRILERGQKGNSSF